MRFRLAVAIVLLCAPPALAQTLSIRSGEHDTFTRLVARLADNTDWDLTTEEGGARLSVDIGNVVFDISGVFARIPRDRLADLSQEAPGDPLVMDLACDCTVKAFEESGGFLVIDIGDPEDPIEDNEPETLVAEPPAPRPLKLPILPAPGYHPTLKRMPLAASNAVSDPESDGEDARRQATELIEEANERAASLSQSERRLHEQIARAATQGLLDVRESDLSDAASAARPPMSETAGPLPINLLAITSVDRDMRQALSPVSVTGGSGRCLEAERLDIAAWGDEQPFGHQVGAYRVRMASEFDDLSVTDLLGLIKTYIYFGFGAEASNMLRSAPARRMEVPLLKALATLMEQGNLPAPHPFQNQEHCDSNAALWSVYANPIGDDASVNPGAVVRSFVVLPLHLRTYLGPNLVRRFTDAGDLETADQLLRLLDRAQPEAKAPLKLAEAELARLHGENETADALVEDVALGGSDQSAQALVALVDRQFAAREPLPTDTMALIDSYVTELRKAPIGPQIRQAQVLSVGLAGDFANAFALNEKLPSDMARETRLEVLTLLIERADDVTFLEHSLAEIDVEEGQLPGPVVLAVARRLIEAGFPGRADALLAQPARTPIPTDFAMVKAQAALALGDPRRALLELVMQDGPAADKIRAQALSQIGAHAEAAMLFAAADADKEAERSEWLAGLPPADNRASDNRNFAEKQEASRRLEDLAEPSREVTLNQARTLLEQSETVRRDVAALTE